MNQSGYTGPVSGDISRGIVRVFAHHVGRGPTKARTVLGPGVVTVVLQDTLTASERTLIERGELDTVAGVRRRLQEAIREDMTSVVEGIMQRKVIAVLGDHRGDIDVSVVVFLLEPEPDGDGAGPSRDGAGPSRDGAGPGGA